MNTVDMKLGLKGRYTLEVRKAVDGSLVRELAFDNIITDSGLNRWGTGGIGSHCKVGTGTTTPTVSDNALVAQVAVTQTPTPSSPYTATYDATGNGKITLSKAFRFDAGAAAGTLAEVGVGWDTGLFSRALIVDGGGTPTTITVLSDEILDVRYTLEVRFPADVTGSISIGGTSYNYTIRPSDIDSVSTDYVPNWLGTTSFASSTSDKDMTTYTGAIGDRVSAPSGSGVGASVPVSRAAYSNNSKQVAVTYTAPTTSLNGTFRSVKFNVGAGLGAPMLNWQIDFGADITKLNTQVFSLTFMLSWNRV